MCQTDVLSSSLSSFFLQNYETNQPVTTLRTSHFSFLKTACLTPWLLHFLHPKFDETCPNEGKGSSRLCCQQQWEGIQERDISFLILSILKAGIKTFYVQMHCSKNNYITIHSKNSIILAGWFDREVWHSQHLQPTVFLMLCSCVDKQSAVATSPSRVSPSFSFSLIRHCWQLCCACICLHINTAVNTLIIYTVMLQVHETKNFKEKNFYFS